MTFEFDIRNIQDKMDFCNKAHRQLLRDIIAEEEPRFLITSLPCNSFSTMQNLNHNKDVNLKSGNLTLLKGQGYSLQLYAQYREQTF